MLGIPILYRDSSTEVKVSSRNRLSRERDSLPRVPSLAPIRARVKSSIRMSVLPRFSTKTFAFSRSRLYPSERMATSSEYVIEESQRSNQIASNITLFCLHGCISSISRSYDTRIFYLVNPRPRDTF